MGEIPDFLKWNPSCVICRAVSVNALIYAINAAAINAIKYFNAINATLHFFECLYLDSYEVRTGSDAEKRWGEDWEITSGQTCVPSGNVARKGAWPTILWER